MASLEEKVAIVTGSSRRIGRAIVERFAKDGDAVVVQRFTISLKAQTAPLAHMGA